MRVRSRLAPAVLALASVVLVVGALSTPASGAPRGNEVVVVNDSSNPVPTTIVGIPTVGINPGQNAVSISGTPTVGIDPAANQVTIQEPVDVHQIQMPVQAFVRDSMDFSSSCGLPVDLPAGTTLFVDKVSVGTFSSSNPPETVLVRASVKVSDFSGEGFTLYKVPLDDNGRGQIEPHLLVKPNDLSDAAVGDVHELSFCYTNANPGTFTSLRAFVTAWQL